MALPNLRTIAAALASGPRPLRQLAEASAISAPDATETCNIGPGELRRRRRSAIVATAAIATALLAVVLGVLPVWSLPFFAPLVGGVVGTVLQVVMRFCIAFGFAGLIGMGSEPGATKAAPELLAAHRRRAALMAGAAALATVGWAAATGLLVLALP